MSNQDGQNPAGQQTDKTRDHARSVAEWTTLAISLAIVLGLVALVLYNYVIRGSDPATIEVSPRTTEVRHEADLFYLPVIVTNRGDRTVEDVRVEISLTSGPSPPASAAFSVQFLAGGETTTAVVAFQQDPTAGTLSYVISYLNP